MKLVIKDKYNITINDYARKIVVSKNVCFGGGLESSYPSADLPLADNDKVIVMQDNEWRQADKSEFGGDGTAQQIIMEYSFHLIVKDGLYSVLKTIYGNNYVLTQQNAFNSDEEACGHRYNRAKFIKEGYKLKNIHISSSYSWIGGDNNVIIKVARRNMPSGNYSSFSVFEDVDIIGEITIDAFGHFVKRIECNNEVVTKQNDGIVWFAKFIVPKDSVTKSAEGVQLQLIFEKA